MAAVLPFDGPPNPPETSSFNGCSIFLFEAKDPMNDWCNRRWKKKQERRHLDSFLQAYNRATGRELTVVSSTERPDFICRRETGTKVGVELTRITRGDPDLIQWDAIVEHREFMSRDQALPEIRRLLIQKDAKRKASDWTLSDHTVLVIQLMETALSRVRGCLSAGLLPDLKTTGFSEVWVADFSALKRFDVVDLFALRHPKLAGHQELNRNKKPWG